MEKKACPIQKQIIPDVKHIIIVASGKGGVGKSTVAAGLALSLAHEGYATGLLDADIFGPSVPMLFGLEDQKPEVVKTETAELLVPFQKFGIKLMSIGFFIEKQQAVIWRGPRVSSGVTQLLTQTQWGSLDYLIIDTPPGTGDVHITLLQNFLPSGVVVVTTPQELSLTDVKKAVSLYHDKQIGIPVLGVVENMAWFTPSLHPDERYFLFGKGGGDALAREFNIPLIAQIPVNENLCATCDDGRLQHLFADQAVSSAFDKLVASVAGYRFSPYKFVKS